MEHPTDGRDLRQFFWRSHDITIVNGLNFEERKPVKNRNTKSRNKILKKRTHMTKAFGEMRTKWKKT